MKKLLKFEKMFKFSKTRIEKLEDVNAGERNWAKKTLKHFTNIHMAQSYLKSIIESIDYYFKLASEITTKNSIQLILNNKMRIIENYLMQNSP